MYAIFYGGGCMGRFVNGLILGGIGAMAGAYYLDKNKDKGRQIVQDGRDVLEKVENCLDKAEQKMM